MARGRVGTSLQVHSAGTLFLAFLASHSLLKKERLGQPSVSKTRMRESRNLIDPAAVLVVGLRACAITLDAGGGGTALVVELSADLLVGLAQGRTLVLAPAKRWTSCGTRCNEIVRRLTREVTTCIKIEGISDKLRMCGNAFQSLS